MGHAQRGDLSPLPLLQASRSVSDIWSRLFKYSLGGGDEKFYDLWIGGRLEREVSSRRTKVPHPGHST